MLQDLYVMVMVVRLSRGISWSLRLRTTPPSGSFIHCWRGLFTSVCLLVAEATRASNGLLVLVMCVRRPRVSLIISGRIPMIFVAEGTTPLTGRLTSSAGCEPQHLGVRISKCTRPRMHLPQTIAIRTYMIALLGNTARMWVSVSHHLLTPPNLHRVTE